MPRSWTPSLSEKHTSAQPAESASAASRGSLFCTSIHYCTCLLKRVAVEEKNKACHRKQVQRRATSEADKECSGLHDDLALRLAAEDHLT